MTLLFLSRVNCLSEKRKINSVSKSTLFWLSLHVNEYGLELTFLVHSFFSLKPTLWQSLTYSNSLSFLSFIFNRFQSSSILSPVVPLFFFSTPSFSFLLLVAVPSFTLLPSFSSSPPLYSLFVWECKKALNQLTEQNNVVLICVSGYSGIKGNEKAGQLAKEGAAGRPIGPEPILDLAPCCTKLAIKNCVV